MFIGRQQELKRLNRMYQSGKLEVAVIYGRRRVGKTTLINEFCKEKRTVFFAAQESSAGQNLEALSNAISELAAGESAANLIYRSFSDAFQKIAEMSKGCRLIWVIDEYPYLAQAERGISSLLQNYLDHQFKDTKLFLILCGSFMSFMENQVLGYQSPLYGRRTAQFKIQPFDYLDTGKWFPQYTCEEKALVYGITGGIPMYLERFSPDLSIKENLLENLFDRNAALFEELSNLLKQELREPAVYNTIITAIASGKTKLSEIASTVGIETGLCSKYIANLILLGIIKRETPVTDPDSKRPIYLIEDQFFRFWYSFVPKNISAIQSGRMEKSYPVVVQNRLSDYMGLTFEKMCRDYILYYDSRIPFALGCVGQWWGGKSQDA
ncbi:MAG: ATP-binding protein [Blautia sp.]|nr:ATP-binding protein [Blautia sp.]